MNSEDLKILGRAVKAKHPEYAAYDDESVGRIIQRKYPSYITALQNASIPSLSPKEVRVFTQQTEAAKVFTAHQQQRTAAMQAVATQQDLPKTREVNLAAIENQRTVIAAATTKGMDTPTYALDVLAERTHARDLAKAEHAQQLAIAEAEAKEDIRLKGYKRETQIDIEAVTTARLLAHSTVLGVSAHLQELIVQREHLLQLAVSEDTRTKLLATQDELIAAFRKNLDVQIQRHLLEAGTQDDVEGPEAASEGKGDGGKDSPRGEN